MKNNNVTPSSGQKRKFPAMVLGLGLAMTAMAFATDYPGTTTISTSVDIGSEDMRLAPDSGSSSTFNITSIGSFTCEGGRVGEKGDYAELNVAVGGSLHMNGEVQGNEDETSDQTIRLNVYGTAYIEQFKFSRESTNDTVIVVGDGTNAATLTILEGYFAKYGKAIMTVNNNSSFIIDNDRGSVFGIDNSGNASGGYIDLVGTGTIKVSNASGGIAGPAGSIIGNGGTTPVTSEVVGDYTVYSTVPTGSTVEITSITVAGTTAAITMTGTDGTDYTCKSSTALDDGFPTTETTVPPSPINTSGGTATFTVEASEAKKFYVIEE